MARRFNRENRNDEIASEITTPENEAAEMLNDSFDVENDTDNEFGDFATEGTDSENVPDEAEMQAAFADAAKDAEGTDLENDDESDAESDDVPVPPAKAVPISSDPMDVQALLAEIYESAELDDDAKMTGKMMGLGLLQPILSSRNSVLETIDLLNKAHFSEAHDDIMSRAEQEKDAAPHVGLQLEKLKELLAEVEKRRAQLSADLKAHLGIKPLTDEERTVEVTNAKSKLGIIATNITIMEGFDAANSKARPMQPVIDYVKSLPELPPVSAKATSTTRKIGAKSDGEQIARVRFGHQNGGGIDYAGGHYDTPTDLIRKMRGDGWEDIKSNDIISQWLEAAGQTDWRKVPLNEPITITVKHPTEDKTAELTFVRAAA